MGSTHQLLTLWWLSGEEHLSACFELLAELVTIFYFSWNTIFIWKNEIHEWIQMVIWQLPDT